jgi:cytochrome c6
MAKKEMVASVAVLAICSFAAIGFAETKKGGQVEGAKEFKEHCAVCHPEGGNIVNSKRTLKKADREANGIKSAKDIIAKMRKPGPGMTAFDAKTIPDKEAKAIAQYILKTF